MTIPFLPPEVDPPAHPEVTAFDGLITGAGLSNLHTRDRETVTETLRSWLSENTAWTSLWDVFWGFIRVPIGWIVNVLEKLFPGFDWDEWDDSSPEDVIESVVELLQEIPFLGDIITWVIGVADGTWQDLQEWFANVWEFFAHINFLGEDFDLLAAAEDFIDFILYPVGKLPSVEDVAEWITTALGDVTEWIGEALSTVTGWISDAVKGLIHAITGLTEGTVELLRDWFSNLKDFLAAINFLDPDFDLIEAADAFITFILGPVGKIPFVADIVEAITGALSGGLEGLTEWFSNLREFFAHVNFFGDDFDLLAAAEDFIDFILFPVGKIAEIDWVETFVGGVQSAVDDVTTFLQDLFGTLGDWIHLDEIVEFFQSLVGMLGLDDLTPGNIIEFIQKRIDHLYAVFNGPGSIGHTLHEVFQSIIDWFTDLPFIRTIVDAFVPGGSALSDIQQWVGKLLDINSWIPAGNLIGQIAPQLLQIIPASHVGDSAANLLTAGGFTTRDTIAAGDGWSWDPDENYDGTGGCVKVVCNNTNKRLFSNLIPVSQRQRMAVSVWVQWSGLSPNTGDHFGVQIAKYSDGEFVGFDTVLVKSSASPSGGWLQLTGDYYSVPTDVDQVRMVLWTDATAGTIWWDDAYFAKTGLGAAVDAISDIFHQGQDQSPFVAGTLLDNLWIAIFAHQKTVTGTAATTLELLNRLSTVSGGAVAADDFERTSTSNIGSGIWEQTYTNSYGKLATPNGHDAEWDPSLLGVANFCMCRYLGGAGSSATSNTPYQSVSVVLGSAPRRGANGTAYNDVVCRLNPSRNYFVRARWGGDGVLRIHKYVNGVETQLTNLAGMAVAASVPIPNAGSILRLDAGDYRLGELWTFTAYQDGQPVLTAYDLAQTSKAESGYLGWGFAVEAQPGWPLGQTRPGKLYHWTGCDQGAGSSVSGSLVSSGINASNVTAGTLDVANRVAAGAVTNTKVASDIDGSKITAGLVNGSRIQTNLSASHISSGTFADAFIASGLSATKLTTGTLDTGRIASSTIVNTHLGTDISGDKITAGLINGTRIQTNLSAGHISSGTFGDAFIASGLSATKLTTGTLNTSRIAAGTITNTHVGTDISGDKITAGLINGSRIQTNLTAGHIASGTFGDSFIASGLSATKLTTGTLDTARISSGTIGNSHLAATGLDISKMTTGTLNTGRIANSSITNTHLGTDISGDKITAGLVNGNRIQTNLTTSHIASGTFADVFVPGLGDISLANLNALMGGSETSTTVSEVAAQLRTLAETVAANAAAIASLQADSDGASNSGISGGDEFERTETTLTGWDENYTSTPKATYGYYELTGHEAVWHAVSGQVNEVFFRRTDTSDWHTNTLFQKVSMVTGAIVAKFPRTGSGGFNDLYIRAKDDKSQWIRARVSWSGSVQMQYKTGGTITDWGSPIDGTQGAGVTWTLVAGTAGSVNQIQLLRNGNVLFSGTFSGFSSVDGTHNGWGWGGKIGTGGNYPSSIARVTVADNVPPTVVGSTARMHRTSGSAQNLVSGSNLLGSSFFSTTTYRSQDIVSDPSMGKFTVLFPGTYMITARVEGNNLGAGSTEEIKLFLYKNGSTIIRYGETATATSGFVPFASMTLNTMVYLEALDYIQLGYNSSFSSSTVKLDGDTDGTGTYFEIALVNRSLS